MNGRGFWTRRRRSFSDRLRTRCRNGDYRELDLQLVNTKKRRVKVKLRDDRRTASCHGRPGADRRTPGLSPLRAPCPLAPFARDLVSIRWLADHRIETA